MHKPILDLKALFQEPKKIFITTHHKPDGDAIGSTLALFHFLKKLGHEPIIALPSALPDFLEWLPGAHEAALDFEKSPDEVSAALQNCELIFWLDFNTASRTKGMTELLQNAIQPVVLIDHHLHPDTAAVTYLFSNPKKSSTCEMVYDFINDLGYNGLLDDNMMQPLYTGLMTDTGSFRFPATTASVHTMVADMKEKGLNHTHIHSAVFDNWSADRMKFLGYILSQKMEVMDTERYGIITITKDEQKKYNVAAGDTEGIVNYLLSIKGILVACFLTERKDEVKLSFRSKGDIDVSTFARTNFEGGGHFNAAGGQFSAGLAGAVAIIKEKMPQLIQASLNK